MSSDSGAAPVITVEGLSKVFRIYDRPRHRLQQLLTFGAKRYYREFTALDDISFTVGRGQAVGIIGRNGSGKSTLLQLICGTLFATRGSIAVDGRVAALLELGAGFNPDFTGRENVYMNAALLGLSRAEVDDRMDAILAFADIGPFVDQPVKTYSSGMFVRLAFAVIAHVDADVLVIDEALAVGDAAFGQKCMRFLRRFRETGTILFVSHDTAAVTGLCDRAIWLDGGKLRAAGEAKAVCEQYFGHIFAGDAPPVAEPSPTAALPTPEDAQTAPPAADRRRVAPEDWLDARTPWLNRTPLRNDIEVFAFDPSGADFGAGGAEIEDVRLTDDDGRPYRWIVGGEAVSLSVRVRALATLDSPIVGFFVKDRLGQTLFGDNTFLTTREPAGDGASLRAAAGDVLLATFRFPMPILPRGTYTLAVAVADGTQEEHTQHHWLHDALTFESHTSHAAAGLVGIPMLDIRLDRATVDAAS
ncbi:ABC transporter ATP-binding protein [Caenispirillum bisanense]|uniref:Lipopolysaccharide transport system ATP-binding protein n=1 Tax=Caenispirillum bisanense TaxID=414052 RepID=A0A286GTB6_9PROT|nr:ABC transporter ATP-binding protein [Caenispirillum bisanense]SOD98778.1 lipopolysaccharide transport system ATP-binding protein [Caenispirillum bisanense]